MRVVIFGASGMVGTGVLHTALASPLVDEVRSIGRRPLDVEHPKLHQIEHGDFTDFSPIAEELQGLDACFWCLGTASGGMDEASYTRVTHSFTMAAAQALREGSPKLRFCFVSGEGTDVNGRQMWARVKGRTEEDLKALGFRDLILFRPGFIRPWPGSGPRELYLRVATGAAMLLQPLLRPMGYATSAAEIGQAMLAAAQGKAAGRTLDSKAINALAAG
ncbi:MAG: NAD(P)H-binding protein [Alphaproteobacteria bacterium]|nr:NAD(P)H-binding protein [Alphaproteobacteria bacterium]MCB9793600.1 NAD(P)H-binding protein [Alphaproteobacteria bacterium]